MHGAMVVDLPHAVMGIHVHIHDALGVGDERGGCHQNARRAQLLLHVGRDPIHLGGVRDIAGEELRRRAAGRDRRCNLLAARLVHIDDRDGIPIGRQPARRRLADAAGPARDDGDLLFSHVECIPI